MKIAILTQPLCANYGGVLQNYALQQILRQLGHEPITLEKNYLHKVPNFIQLSISIPKRIITKYILKKREYIFDEKHYNNAVTKVRAKLYPFIKNYIYRLWFESWKTINPTSFDAFIVGSDQVWRPRYNVGKLDKMFLSFIPEDRPIKRIAYAASFGADEWEYTEEQTKECQYLAKRFNAVSVREDSGVELCKKHLDIDATHVLDPTLLLDKKHYNSLCAEIPTEKGYLCAYILDLEESEKSKLEEIAKSRGLNLKICSADNDCTLSIEEWLAMFRDAEMIVTNSFHGTVFSIIFNKEFYSITHSIRGGSRIPSLFRQLNINTNRLLTDITEIPIGTTKPLDWGIINDKIESLKEKSLNFLREHL